MSLLILSLGSSDWVGDVAAKLHSEVGIHGLRNVTLILMIFDVSWRLVRQRDVNS